MDKVAKFLRVLGLSSCLNWTNKVPAQTSEFFFTDEVVLVYPGLGALQRLQEVCHQGYGPYVRS